MSIETSIIVPCYNEQTTIHLLLDALYAQSFPRDQMEVVIADGGSNDGTLDVIRDWHQKHADLRVVIIENPARTIPAALNKAIYASRGAIIVRLDAHSKPDHDYVARSFTAVGAERGQNVGGVWDIQPGSDHWVARSIAAAAGHPIGVGDARYRYSGQAAFVDTVPFGAFKRKLLDQVGMFDETLLTNEDYEFNTRIRQAGGKIWFDPQIRSVYYSRENLTALARQYWRYGFWKVQMLRRYPSSIRWRQALPPLFVLALIFLAIISPFLQAALWVLVSLISVYLTILIFVGIYLAVKQKTAAFSLGVPLAIACMHFSWGAGFLWGLIRPQKRN